MKNKKLFAILTLVCFMFTLMPVAAFAAEATLTSEATITVSQDAVTGDVTYTVKDSSIKKNDTVAIYSVVNSKNDTKGFDAVSYADGTAVYYQAAASYTAMTGGIEFTADTVVGIGKTGETPVDTAVVTKDMANKAMWIGATGYLWATWESNRDADVYALLVNAYDKSNGLGIDASEAALVAQIISYNNNALAAVYYNGVTNAEVADSLSAVEAQEDSAAVKTETVAFDLNMRSAVNNRFEGTTDVYVWVTKDGSAVPVDTAVVANGRLATIGSNSTPISNVYKVEDVKTGEAQLGVVFYATGTYRVHVSANVPTMTSGAISNASEFDNSEAVVTVYSTSSLKVEDIRLDVEFDNKVLGTNLVDGAEVSAVTAVANNVQESEVKVTLKDKAGNVLSGKTLEIESAGAIEVSDETVTTNVSGIAKFDVAGVAEGTYEVYVSYGNFEVTILVQVGATIASSIEGEGTAAPTDILGATNFADVIEFTMYDVNGNEVAADEKEDVAQGWDKANDWTSKYVTIVEQPAASKLKDSDVYFDGETIAIATGKTIAAEGTYSFKVVLNNGAFAIASCEVKEFQTPVEIRISGTTCVELGAPAYLKATYIDANGVTKNATTKADWSVSGYAVDTHRLKNATRYAIWSLTDEKYEGAIMNVTVSDDRYDLVATHQIKIAKGEKTVVWDRNEADVKVNNSYTIKVVDEDGDAVKLCCCDATVKFVVLDKPEGANVFVNGSYKNGTQGNSGKMTLTSDKVGNVAVQAIVQFETQDAFTTKPLVKYYTCTQIFAVGTGSVGDVVVMSVGSNEIVINDAVSTIDAAPIVENSRTFVPFRALAEAFGAEVAYDEATQAVTAELNGVTIVMTIGSAEYTINGETATMDVAPFINGSRTMVPVRFAAEAFGIKVIPTYNENGATADILFNL